MSSRSVTPLSDVPLSRRVMITNSRGKIISIVSENFLGDGTSSPPSSGTEYVPSSEFPEDAQSEVPSEVSTIEASSFSTHIAPRGRKDILYPSSSSHVRWIEFAFLSGCLFLLIMSFLQDLFFVPVVLVALLKLIDSEKLLKVVLPVLTVEDVGLTMRLL
ncbi:16381_t:CDS:2, partial [Acaulospora morrowiae]